MEKRGKRERQVEERSDLVFGREGRVWLMYVVAIRGRVGVGVAQRSNNLAGSSPRDAPPRHVP